MSRLLVVEHEADAGLGLMAGPLAGRNQGGAEGGVEGRVEVVRPYRGEALPGDEVASSGRFDGLVVLGGEMAAWEDDVAPWLPATRRLLAAAVRAQLPTLGICLGAQLLAHATGGLAERGDAGLEIGAVEVCPLPAAAGDPLLPSGPVRALTYHRDAVTRLPADAEVLITGEVYPVQAFRVGACAWGVQYHPEVSAGGFRQWMATLPPDFPDLELLHQVVQEAAGPQRRLATAHAQGFLQAVGLPSPP